MEYKPKLSVLYYMCRIIYFINSFTIVLFVYATNNRLIINYTISNNIIILSFILEYYYYYFL